VCESDIHPISDDGALYNLTNLLHAQDFISPFPFYLQEAECPVLYVQKLTDKSIT
jgi:hypothetical protein